MAILWFTSCAICSALTGNCADLIDTLECYQTPCIDRKKALCVS